jgi:hypothetical protein
MNQWNIIHFKNVTEEQLRDSQVRDRCAVVYNAIKAKRAEIIEAALSVEGLLDLVLLDLLVGHDPEKRERLSELILAAEFCTSFQKWKMLRRLMSATPAYFKLLSDAEGKALRDEIRRLIEDRNKFAHGDLFVNVRENYVVEIRFYDDGTQFLRVTDQTVTESLARALRCRETLWKLHHSFGTDLQTTIL